MGRTSTIIPAASTGSQRGVFTSTAPIPSVQPSKMSSEDAQAGPSHSRATAQMIAGSRRKLNLNDTQATNDDRSGYTNRGGCNVSLKTLADQRRLRQLYGSFSSVRASWPITSASNASHDQGHATFRWTSTVTTTTTSRPPDWPRPSSIDSIRLQRQQKSAERKTRTNPTGLR